MHGSLPGMMCCGPRRTMSESHLHELRKALEASHWVIVSEAPGNGYDIAGAWAIARPDGSSRLTIAFAGLDDLRTLPIEQSYGCHLEEAPEISLYLARINRSWNTELSAFVRRLEAFTAG